MKRTTPHTGDGTWQLLSCTFDFSTIYKSNIKEIAVKFQSENLAEFSAVVAYAKLEVGSVATGNSLKAYAEELSLCQRYYQRIDVVGVGVSVPTGIILNLPLLSPVRKTYTITDVVLPSVIVDAEGLSKNATELLPGGVLRDSVIEISPVVEGLTSGNLYYFFDGKISVDAEIY